MSCRIAKAILVNEIDQEVAYLYDSVTGWAFGPQFEGVQDAASFLTWLGEGPGTDPRGFSDPELMARYVAWLDWKKAAAEPTWQGWGPAGAIKRHS